MEALMLKRKMVRAAFTRLCNQLDEKAKMEVKFSEDLECLASFQLLGEKNSELLQLNDKILNILLTSEIVKDSDIEKETVSADDYSLRFKKDEFNYRSEN